MTSEATNERKSVHPGPWYVDGSGNLPDFRQDADLWFEDGSIVVVAGNTGYRVHTSLLTRFSPIFRDMMVMPPPPDAPAVQGVPLVHVPDSAHDFKCLLRAIYEPRRLLDVAQADIPFATISALIRLGHKYEMPDVVDEAARHLEKHFTTDFKTWMKYCDKEDFSDIEFSEDRNADYIEAVNLARLTGRNASLPLALYCCCQLDISEILQGVERESGEIVRLSLDDAERCIRGREGLLRASAELMSVVESEARGGAPCDSCTRQEQCARKMKDMLESVLLMLCYHLTTEVLSGKKPMGSLLANDAGGRGSLCHDCRDSLFGQYRVRQRITWGELPKILGISADELFPIVWVEPHLGDTEMY
ncbi:hypothetical protein OH77DRAFT_1489151 [Trametes cingulata]|nr:hypothetical protein OH77DRAFT_1489151 [Trametes cingulata]